MEPSCYNMLPLRSKLPLLCSFLLYFSIYYSAFINLWAKWSNEDFNYCILILPVTLYLVFDKRKQLARIPSCPSWKGLYFILPGLLLFWIGELGGEFFTLYLSSWLVFVGLMIIHFGGSKLKPILFPLIFLLAMFPPPDFIYKNLSLQLKLISSQIGVAIMQAYGMSAYREGNIIDIGYTKLQVVDACSGLRYLIPLIILGLLLAYLFKARLWKKITILLSTLPLTILTNSLRIALTGILSEIWGPEVAEGFFHGFSGWFIFMFSLIVLFCLMWLLNVIFPEKGNPSDTRITGHKTVPQPAPESADRPSLTRILKPKFYITIILLGATVMTARGIEFREQIPIKRPLNEFPSLIGDWKGGPSIQMEAEFLGELDLNDYTIINFQNMGGAQINFYVAYYESQRKGESIHSPRTCLPGSGWEFRQAGSIHIPLNGEEPLRAKVNRAVISKAGYHQLSYYWFPMRGRVLTNLFEMKWYNFLDAVTRQRTDGALVRLITPITKNETVEDADARLQSFTRELVPVLNEFLPR